ncbi:MAG: hypothetical protein AAGA77_19585 [Bacteroidota bacterium]
MERQYLSKTEKLSKVGSIEAPSKVLEAYFVRYLAFQNKIVKEISVDRKDK